MSQDQDEARPARPPAHLVRQALLTRDAVRAARGDPETTLAALRRYDGALARLAEGMGVERPPLVDRSPAGRNRRRREVERQLAARGVDLGW